MATAPPWEALVEGGPHSPSLAVRGRDGPGAPVVLLHGLGGTLEEWDPVAGLLAPRHPVYTYDLRGHGRSADGDWTVDGCVDDLARVIERFGLRAPAVAGYGLGGAVTALFAARRADLTAAVSIDGFARPDADVVAAHLGIAVERAAAAAATVRAFLVDQLAAACSPMPAEVFDRLVAGYRTGVWEVPGAVAEATALRASVREDRLVSLRPGPRAVRAMSADLDARETDGPAADPRVPTLAVVGDGAFPPIPGAPALLREVLAARAAGELAAPPRANRSAQRLAAPYPAHMTRPEAVADAIESFLTGPASG
ncbi:alpha/beta fold hydrolase [Streptomonospora salina]|uniref:Pimeloyl-ACP methyl ester carboxylesterase n=1 Tax=Streptomonospora salina TaxID=104205 RepID=A0A841EJG4_9ACTN|nr:alpha/beta hydrolase [Streptomonospora salina]MBB5999561.1 pimeloyl-ACP methyl ester carboxylesterase [Streptomonospora salina]